MKLDVDPAARSALLRVFILSICLGCVAATILALTNLSVVVIGLYPDRSLAFQVLTVFYLLVGGSLVIFIYRMWGGASCLADISVWLAVLLALVGSVAIQRMFCAFLNPMQSAVHASRVSLVCDPSYQRAVAYGSALAVVIITLAVWAAVRYLGRQVRNRG